MSNKQGAKSKLTIGPKFLVMYKAKWLQLFGIVLMMSLLPVFADWIKDSYQVSFQDLALPVCCTVLNSIIVTLIFRNKFRENKFAALMTSIFVVFLLNQDYEQRLIDAEPVFKALNPIGENFAVEKIVSSLLFLLLIFALSGVIYKFIKIISEKNKWRIDNLSKAIIITISVAFILQFFSVGKTLIYEWPQFFYKPPKLITDAKVAVSTQRPDIYYIVLDRYTNQNVLQNQFNFSNADFVNFLQSNNFSVNPDAKDNYPYTTMSIASTLNANYLSDIVGKFGDSSSQTVIPYHEAIRNSSVISELKSFGYKYYHLGTWYEASNQAPLADYYYQDDGQFTILNQKITLNEFSRNELKKSVFWRIVNLNIKIGNFKILTYGTQTEVDATIAKINTLKDIASESSGGRFIFAHILVPHEPYYFNADGSLSSKTGSDNEGEMIKQKYVNQVEFINSQMQAIVIQIKQKSNNQAVIIIQSDEGPYPLVLNDRQFNTAALSDEIDNSNMTKWSNTDLTMKYGILAAYDIPKATSEDLAKGGDSVNIFRLVLNTYFGANMPYLTNCYYAYPDGRSNPINFQNINQQLTGQKNDRCPQNSDFSKK